MEIEGRIITHGQYLQDRIKTAVPSLEIVGKAHGWDSGPFGGEKINYTIQIKSSRMIPQFFGKKLLKMELVGSKSSDSMQGVRIYDDSLQEVIKKSIKKLNKTKKTEYQVTAKLFFDIF
ncbi:hypothetical protein CMI40_02425 [Candidatus Pacearchaeota archaeon]|jgi:hypothetical protein|nr:hypothetical protein [Candidatus Pacearchaeota archaeon]|tara:strand:+ start:2767 stop:3123 length:357 start_codon:yes stop_codon:yes gene_type:complete